MNKATNLQAKILAINTANKHASEIAAYEIEQLRHLIGTNPLKVDGSFKAKIKHEKKQFEKIKISMFGFDWHAHTTYYFTAEYGYFVARIKTCVSGGGSDMCGVRNYCIYENNSIDIFKIDKDGNFQESDRPAQEFPQYQESELLSIAKEVKAAAEEYKKVFNKMPYEFRYELNIERLTR